MRNGSEERESANARLRIQVQPRAKANDVRITEDGVVRVRVTAAPEAGKANEAVVDVLASALGVTKSAIVLKAGHTSRQKLVEVPLRIQQVRRLLAEGASIRRGRSRSE